MKKIRIFIGIAISLLFIAVVFRNANFAGIIDTLKQINYIYLIPAVIVQVSSYWVRSLRWSKMLDSIKKIKVYNLFQIISISYALNNTLPLRAGDISRAYLIGKKEGISKTAAFSTVILEKIYDGIVLLLFLGLISILFPFPLWVKSIGLLTTAAFSGALAFIIMLVSLRTRTLNFIQSLLRFAPDKVKSKVLELLEKLIDGFDTIKDRKSLIPIALYSIMVWILEAFMIFAIAKCFGFSGAVYIAAFTVVIVNLGIMIPSSPGYIGTFEYFCVKSLSLFKIGSDAALSFALVFRVALITPITVVGFYYMVKNGLSLSSLTSRDNDSKD